MSARYRRSGGPPRKPKPPVRGRALDAVAQEAIDRCAWVIARCGYSPEESARRFQWRCDQIPASVIRRGGATRHHSDLTAHVLTLWSQEREYLLPSGEMRPLKARGTHPSIEALVLRVGGALTLEKAMEDLLSSQTLQRRRGKYVPRDSWVAHPSNSIAQHAHHMRVFVDFLRTLDHNTRARSMRERWFQYSADNASVPESQIAALSLALRAGGFAFLKDKDTLMYRMARARKGGESAIPVSIGIYLSQASGGVSAKTVRRSKSK